MKSAAAIQNATYQDRLGWTLAELGIVEVVQGEDLVSAIRTLQMNLGLMPVDGVCGPKTYAAALEARQARLITSPPLDVDARLRNAGIVAICEAKIVWLRNIVDLPPRTSLHYERSRTAIDDMIRTPAGINWTWQRPYLSNYEWCGAFAAYAWRAAGLSMFARRNYWSSNYRLDLWAQYLRFEDHANPRPPTGPYRMMIELDEHSSPASALFPDGTAPRAGDVLTVGGVNTAYGKHVTLVETYDASSGTFHTVEGNGTGLSPAGNKQHGVIRAQRRIGLLPGASPATYFARRLIRPAPSDLV